MEDIIFSRQQFDAIINRLDGLKLDLNYLKRQKELVSETPVARMDRFEILQHFHISRSTLIRWCKKGAIRYEKIGGRVFYDPAGVFEYGKTVKGRETLEDATSSGYRR